MKFVVLLSLLVTANAVSNPLTELYEWNKVDFAYPTPEARQAAIDSKEYIPENNLPLGLETFEDMLFVTVPRWRTGTPSSLNYVKLNDTQQGKSPLLIPFPDWKSNMLPADDVEDKSSIIISNLRPRVDACKRLWVMDIGVIDLMGSNTRITPPKIMVYDLITNKLLRTYNIRDDQMHENTLFVNMAVESSSDDCEKAFAYIPDQGSYSLIIYSWKDNDSWRVTHNFFHSDPLQGNFNVSGLNFQWTDGVFGVALSPKHEDGYSTLYFHAIASSSEFSVSTKTLQNRSTAGNYYDYTALGSHGNNSQATSSFVDPKTGVLFLAQVNKNGVGCWNTNKPFNADTQGIVAQDDEKLVYINDLRVSNDSQLYVLSDKLPHFLFNAMDFNETNFRIMRAPVSEVIKGSVCE